MSMAVYALAVPRAQATLYTAIKLSRDSKANLERRIKKEKLGVDEIKDQLDSIEEEQGRMLGQVTRLRWSRVVVVPATLSSIALALNIVLIISPGGYDLLLLMVSISLLIVGFVHLLQSLRLLEETATGPELSIEGRQR